MGKTGTKGRKGGTGSGKKAAATLATAKKKKNKASSAPGRKPHPSVDGPVVSRSPRRNICDDVDEESLVTGGKRTAPSQEPGDVEYVHKRRKTRRGETSSSSNNDGHQQMNRDTASSEILSPDGREKYLQMLCAPREPQVSQTPTKPKKKHRYPTPLKTLMVRMYQDGKDVPKHMQRSIQRWIKRGVASKKPTGNKKKTRMRGETPLPHCIIQSCLASRNSNGVLCVCRMVFLRWTCAYEH